MKNNIKFFVIFLIINVLHLTNVSSNEPFNFDITELEIIENGNILKGYKGGTATTDNGLKIKADSFEYNKVQNILIAFGNVKITDEINNYIILSEKITYIKNQEKILTKGKTKAIMESRFNFLSSNVLFLRDEMILSSDEKSSLIDGELHLYKFAKFNYSINDGILKAEKIEVVYNFKETLNEIDFYYFDDGILNIKNKNFIAGKTKIKVKKNSFDNSKNDPRIYGVSSHKKGDITTINKGVFTSCKVNDTCPPWSLSSSKIMHDSKKKQIIYKDSVLKIYDFPILYFPKFFHPDPTVGRQSGLLQPQLNNSNILGSSIRIPYFHVLAENKDLTFTPNIFDKNIFMIQNEYREENKNSSFIADLGFVKGYKSVVTDNKKKKYWAYICKI